MSSFTSTTIPSPTSPASLLAHPHNTAPRPLSRAPRRSAGLGSLATAASTPNLNTLYSAHSRLAPPGLSRKASFQALTSNSLASIPDDTESYALDSVLNEPVPSKMPSPLTPGRGAAADNAVVAIGDTVDVPGNMHGTVRFVGSVQGRKGVFAGVELHPDFASRGKNNGDVDGISYFTTANPGAGIFLPLSKAIKRDSPPTSASSFPLTPTMAAHGGLKAGNQNSTNFTPPTPSIPKFNQSIGPGRAASPAGKRPRTSLPRPDSPLRRLQVTPAPRPSVTTPATKAPSRYGVSPTVNKFSQSVRGPPGDPNKRGLKLERKPSMVPRSASALGGSTAGGLTDDETTPVGLQRTKTNGSVGSASVSSFSAKLRPASRATNTNTNGHSRGGSDEVEKLRAQLGDRDKQLKEQAQTLAEMESSLTELQMLIENPDGLPPPRRGSLDDKDSVQLRALLREKNDKIAMLTAEFDAHRADFRSTIDTLELASTETERVYEKKLEEVMQELHDYQERTSDVNAVARQLKQLEELVQELEEGLEDARRGEAEARGEVEFLRGEVERTRSELRREREKAAAVANGNGGNPGAPSKELEQKEDEIRGLKAIIHSLSRDSVPGLPPATTDSPDKTPTTGSAPFPRAHRRNESLGERLARERLARERLEREVSELRALLDSKNNREAEMQRELEQLRPGSGGGGTVKSNGDRSSFRDSRGTVILARDAHEPRSPEGPTASAGAGAHHHPPKSAPHPPPPAPSSSLRKPHHARVATLDTMPESDAYSTATENSTLWCEICETSGHDILTCTNMFGPDQKQSPNSHKTRSIDATKDMGRVGLKGLSPNVGSDRLDVSATPAPLSPMKAKAPPAPAPAPASDVRALPNLMESGPVAGKESKVVDVDKWCALCERDGHDSVDCPFEDAF